MRGRDGGRSAGRRRGRCANRRPWASSAVEFALPLNLCIPKRTIEIGHRAEARISGRTGGATGSDDRAEVRIGNGQRGDAVLRTVIVRRVVRHAAKDIQCSGCRDWFAILATAVAAGRSGTLGIPTVRVTAHRVPCAHHNLNAIDFSWFASTIPADTSCAVQNFLTGDPVAPRLLYPIPLSIVGSARPLHFQHHHTIPRATRPHALVALAEHPPLTCRGIRGIGWRRARVHPPLAHSRTIPLAAGAGGLYGAISTTRIPDNGTSTIAVTLHVTRVSAGACRWQSRTGRLRAGTRE